MYLHRSSSPAKKAFIPALLFAFIVVEMIIIGGAQPRDHGAMVSRGSSVDVSIPDVADRIVRTCAAATYRPTCYEEEIPKLMDSVFTMEQTFQVVRGVQDKDPSYSYCHVLGHKLSAKETAKDPDAWEDIITRCPSGLCSNGCIHGAFQERFRVDSLPPEQIQTLEPSLKMVCEPRGKWSPTGLEQGSCYHAVGHLLMYVNGGDVVRATDLCDAVTNKGSEHDFRKLCYDGVFMQIFQPLEPEDFALVKGKQPKKEELVAYCDAFMSTRRLSCWSEGWPLYFEEITTPQGLVRFCAHLDVMQEQDQCFNALFYVLTAQFELDEQKVSTFCAGLPSQRKDQCFANAASRMIETDYRNIDRAMRMCEEAKRLGDPRACYEELVFYAKYNFHAGSQEFFHVCGSLPAPWSLQCFAQE